MMNTKHEKAKGDCPHGWPPFSIDFKSKTMKKNNL